MKLISGCQAIAQGALDAGARFFAGYPISPINEIADLLAAELPKTGGKFLQMEDEIAALGSVIGASAVGLKSLTATAGPGFTLMQEHIRYASINEVPLVIVHSAGQDIMQARFGAQGDYPVAVLYPSSVREAYDLTIYAFNLSEKHRIPVILLIDQLIASMREVIEFWESPKLTTRAPARRHFFLSTMPTDNEGLLTHDPKEIKSRQINFLNKYNSIERLFSHYELDDAKTAVIAYGTTVRAARAAIKIARQKKHKVGLLKLINLWPLPKDEIKRMSGKMKRIIVAETNWGQAVNEVKAASRNQCEIKLVTRLDGKPITPKEIYDGITA